MRPRGAEGAKSAHCSCFYTVSRLPPRAGGGKLDSSCDEKFSPGRKLTGERRKKIPLLSNLGYDPFAFRTS